MDNNLLTQADLANQRGDLEQAINILQELLNNEPENIDALNYLSFIYTQQNNFTAAIDCLQRAVTYQPNDGRAYNHLGNIYRRLGEFDKAAINYISSLKINPNYTEAHNNYGLLLYQQQHYELAEQQFILALEGQKDHVAAMYNLALTLYAEQKIALASASLLALIEAFPQYYRAYLLLGKIFLQEKLLTKAMEYFTQLLRLDENNVDHLIGVVNCLLAENYYREALPYTEKIIQLQPNNVETLYNLAVIANRQHNVDQAEHYYQAVLQLDAQHFAALNNLGFIYLQTKRYPAAIEKFNLALAIQPNNEAIKYALSMMQNDHQVARAPQEYLQKLFDSYAENFDVHLREGLNYVVPELLQQQIITHVKPNHGQWNILDLGCGTGLCGEVFKPWAKHLVGVDVSTKMLEKAAQKGCYDELIVMDNQQYLNQLLASDAYFDLILAADVFVYQGDLKDILRACRMKLTPSGILAFSIELCEMENYRLQNTGRFAHSLNYIELLAQQLGFNLITKHRAVTRKQQEGDVVGGIIIMING